MIERRPLGKTGLEVPVLSLGGLFVSGFAAELEDGIAAVHRAVEMGMDYIDTAPSYHNSEEVLGQALAGVDSPVILSTKLGGRPTPFEPKNISALRGSVEESLRLLGRESIDILFIHEPERPMMYDWWDSFDTADGPVMELLSDLKDEGIIRYIGLGGTTVYEMVRLIETAKFDVVLTAFNYSLLWREAEKTVISSASKLGMGIVVGSPLQQGALSARYDDQIAGGAPWLSPQRREQYKALYTYLDEIGMTVVEASMRLVISNPDISCTLTGSRSVREVEENAAFVGKGPLPADVLSKLDEIAAMVPFRPFEEPAGMPFRREYKGPGPVHY